MSKNLAKKSKTKAWISAMRLRTLPLSFSVILLGSSLANLLQESDSRLNLFGEYNWNILILTLTTTLLLQILSNLANDYGDSKKGADNENRIGPERAIQSGIISHSAMLNGIIITAVLSLITGIWLLLVAFNYNLNWTFISFIVLGLLAIAAAVKYTVGKRAYGYSGLGDLFVFIFFGLVGVAGTFYLHTPIFGWLILLPGITMGCFSVAVLNLNNMRDRENDQRVGKNTLVVKMGFKKSKVYHYFLFILAYLAFPIPMAIASAIFDSDFRFFIPLIPVLAIHIAHIVKVYKITDPKDFDPELKKIALSTFLYALLFFAVVLIFD